MSARNFLNIFSLNDRSIVLKLTELRTFLVPSLFHILAFSETWLKSRHSNQLVAFDGSNVIRCDCSRAAGGDAAFRLVGPLHFDFFLFIFIIFFF
jgi:hypothetical protein